LPVDLQKLSATQREQEVQRLAAQIVLSPFNLTLDRCGEFVGYFGRNSAHTGVKYAPSYVMAIALSYSLKISGAL